MLIVFHYNHCILFFCSVKLKLTSGNIMSIDRAQLLEYVPYSESSFYLESMTNHSEIDGEAIILPYAQSNSPLQFDAYLIEACAQTFLSSQLWTYKSLNHTSSQFFLASIDDVHFFQKNEDYSSQRLTASTRKLDLIANIIIFEAGVKFGPMTLVKFRAKCFKA